MQFDNQQKIFKYYLLALAVIGMSFAFLVTYRYGAGLSTDGARYLSTAENLINGKGFYDYLGEPLTQFPPLYSVIIAGFSFMMRTDVFIVGQYLNILTFGWVIWLAGIFFRRIFPENYSYAYIGSAVFTTSISLVRIASNILSDLLFLALAILFLISATNALSTPTKKNLLIMGIIACISPFQRYAGLTFILTASVIIFILYRKEIFKGAFLAGIFAVLASLPIILWVIFHNYLRTGILFGVRRPPSFEGNLGTTIEKAVHWFIPYSVTTYISEGVIIALILLIVLTGNRQEDWKRWGKQILTPQFLPSLIFLLFYVNVLIFNVSYSEVRWPFMDRIHIIILPAFMALGFLTARELMPIYLRKIPAKTMQSVAALIFILWLAYPVNNLQKYLRSAYFNGEISEYNLYNTRALNESGVREFLASQPIPSGDEVYSNYEPVAWLYTRRTILKLPQGPIDQKKPDPELVLQNYPDWPGVNGRGYVIWMKKLGFKPYVLAPEQLSSRIDFQIIFSSREGDVYTLTPE
jgi:hypothetical protein